MSPPIKIPKPHLEVADILRHHIAEYRNTYPLAPDQHRIVSHLLHCRTPALGGHIERCTHCGAERILYAIDTAPSASTSPVSGGLKNANPNSSLPPTSTSFSLSLMT